MSELVSIIMPAYNASKYIEKSIESVLLQTYKNWELIVVNDCSKDNTKDIVEQLSASNSCIKLINLNKNKGITNARNTAIKSAKGRYLAFLDSDDLWKPDKLEKQIQFMQKNDCYFTFTAYELIDERGEHLNKKINVPSKVKYKDLLKVNSIGCLTVLIDRFKIRPFEMPKIKHEDYATWLTILKENDIEAFGINESLAYYRKSNNSVSSNKIKTLNWTWNIYNKHLGYSKVLSSFMLLRFIKNTLSKYK